jgi:hypothetical protein
LIHLIECDASNDDSLEIFSDHFSETRCRWRHGRSRHEGANAMGKLKTVRLVQVNP